MARIVVEADTARQLLPIAGMGTYSPADGNN
jgi:hypothetical protein